MENKDKNDLRELFESLTICVRLRLIQSIECVTKAPLANVLKRRTTYPFKNIEVVSVLHLPLEDITQLYTSELRKRASIRVIVHLVSDWVENGCKVAHMFQRKHRI